MKTKKLILSLFALFSLSLAACSTDGNSSTSGSSGSTSGGNTSNTSGGTSGGGGGGDQTVAVSNVTVQASLNLALGDDYQLTATVLPNNATNPSVTWASDNQAVATVEQSVTEGNKATVTAVGEGTAHITVTSVAYPAKHATCTVTVPHVVNPETEGFALKVGTTYHEMVSASIDPVGEEDVTEKYKVVGLTLQEDNTINFYSDGTPIPVLTDMEGTSKNNIKERPSTETTDPFHVHNNASGNVYLKHRVKAGEDAYDYWRFWIDGYQPSPSDYTLFTVTMNEAPAATNTVLVHVWKDGGTANDTVVATKNGATLTFNLLYADQYDQVVIAELNPGETEFGPNWANVLRQTADSDLVNNTNYSWNGGSSTLLTQGYYLTGDATFMDTSENPWEFYDSHYMDSEKEDQNLAEFKNVEVAGGSHVQIVNVYGESAPQTKDWYRALGASYSFCSTVGEHIVFGAEDGGSYNFFIKVVGTDILIFITKNGGETPLYTEGYYLTGDATFLGSEKEAWEIYDDYYMDSEKEEQNLAEFKQVEVANGSELKVVNVYGDGPQTKEWFSALGAEYEFCSVVNGNIVFGDDKGGTYNFFVKVVEDVVKIFIAEYEEPTPDTDVVTITVADNNLAMTKRDKPQTGKVTSWDSAPFNAVKNAEVVVSVNGTPIEIWREGETSTDISNVNERPSDSKVTSVTIHNAYEGANIYVHKNTDGSYGIWVSGYEEDQSELTNFMYLVRSDVADTKVKLLDDSGDNAQMILTNQELQEGDIISFKLEDQTDWLHFDKLNGAGKADYFKSSTASGQEGNIEVTADGTYSFYVKKDNSAVYFVCESDLLNAKFNFNANSVNWRTAEAVIFCLPLDNDGHPTGDAIKLTGDTATLPAGTTKVCLARCHAGATQIIWDGANANVWNQSDDLNISNGTLTVKSWDGGNNNHSVFEWL